ncbi:thermonuclease family protein [Mycoplasma sp. VS424B]|uniref:thermonuclease family protein n=1 Tax=Mycoplasma sp. VS424B TaxID=3401660 RepID=UPI003AAE9D7F
MRIKSKKWLMMGSILPIIGFATPLIAVSCDFTPVKEAYSQNNKINYSNDKEIKTFNVKFDSDNAFKFNVDTNAQGNLKTAKIVSKKILEGTEIMEFGDALEKLSSDINQAVTSTFNIEYRPVENSTYIMPSASQFFNIPKQFNVNVENADGEKIVLKYVLQSFDQSFSNWNTGLKLGVKGQNDQDAALNLTKIKAISNFVYMPFINKNTEVVELSSSITKENEMTINPVLSKYQTAFNKENFKNSGIDWSKVDSSLYFDGKITNTADGDTFTVQASADKIIGNNVGPIGAGSSHIIRLAGIDTPEKAVGNKSGSVTSAPFEYAFALMPTHFAEELWKTYGDHVRVAFIDGKDTFGRLTADVFFGDNYQYSYNTEVVRAGFTLPLAKSTVTVNNYNSLPKSYEALIYPEIAKAMHEAVEAKRGFFHYFETPTDVSRFIYLIKPNTSYVPFEQIYNKIAQENK